MSEPSFTEPDTAERISQQMIDSGWKRHDILQHPKIPSHKGYSFQADFILLYELYPLAVVEVKRLSTTQLSIALEQASHYAKQVGLTISLATNGTQHVSKNLLNQEVKTWNQFPTPKDFLTELGRNLDLKDLRLATVLPFSNHIRLPQVLAIKENIDALISGKKDNLTVMPQGSGSTFVIGQIIHKIIASDDYQRVIYISDRLIYLEQTYQ